jgi:hypothetical protein
MTALQVIGFDPGPTPGIGIIAPGYMRFMQVHHELAIPVLRWLITRGRANGLDTVIGQERFVVSLRASKSAHAAAGTLTRDLNGAVGQLANGGTVRVVEVRASDWKPWAIRDRLDAAGVLEMTKGSQHARDGLGIALYVGHNSAGMSDPLSKAQRGWSVRIRNTAYQPSADGAIHIPPNTVAAGEPLGLHTGTNYMVQETAELPESIRRAIDATAGDEARYIGLERHLAQGQQ